MHNWLSIFILQLYFKYTLINVELSLLLKEWTDLILETSAEGLGILSRTHETVGRIL